MKVLVINCGSSSLKYQLIDSETEQLLAKGLCERIGIDGRLTHTGSQGKITIESPMPDHNAAVDLVLKMLQDPEHGVVKSLDEIGAVGHRVVHGGERFSRSVPIDEAVIADIEKCNYLAPLHNPANIIGIRACQALMPGKPMVAVFDTAFHQTMPKEAFLYGIPIEYYEQDGCRRYGFHGTSHAYVSKRAAEILGKDVSELKTIVCHLGNGASICAVDRGRSVDTSMGLTPLAGLVMGTRSGDIDPSFFEFMAVKEGLSVDEILPILNKKSGVYGLSGGISSDFRDLQAAKDAGNEKAKTAIDVFCYRVAKFVGSYAAAMNGVDVICFTAGVGENSPAVRAQILSRLEFLGLEVDPEANEVRGKEAVITKPGSKVTVLVVPTNEELMICRETEAIVEGC
ncbi:MAG: acetate kinase [Lachnospiraceae bacterium]|nr:acetate kinase [Lachnospiraceae bacterium]